MSTTFKSSTEKKKKGAKALHGSQYEPWKDNEFVRGQSGLSESAADSDSVCTGREDVHTRGLRKKFISSVCFFSLRNIVPRSKPPCLNPRPCSLCTPIPAKFHPKSTMTGE
jgi:hypothetical protein